MHLISKETDYCPICYGRMSKKYVDSKDRSRYLCDCYYCGRFISSEKINFLDSNSGYDIDEVASFLFYHGDKGYCDKEQLNPKVYSFDGGMISNEEIYDDLGLSKETRFSCIPVNDKTIKNWMPKSFSEKMDKVLLFLEKETPSFGYRLNYSENEIMSLFFLKRHEVIHGSYKEPMSIESLVSQTDFFVKCMTEEKYVDIEVGLAEKWEEHWCSLFYPTMDVTRMRKFTISLMPAGYKRIDTVEKENISNRDVFIAMAFKDTEKLRKCIKEGIEMAGYIPILIDEVEHNNLILPEILYNIRHSLFVVAELTHKNAGAYLEEGYALGYGKQVIQLCKESELKGLHFDISQKNTVVWNNEEEIPEKLCKRIKATME